MWFHLVLVCTQTENYPIPACNIPSDSSMIVLEGCDVQSLQSLVDSAKSLATLVIRDCPNLTDFSILESVKFDKLEYLEIVGHLQFNRSITKLNLSLQTSLKQLIIRNTAIDNISSISSLMKLTYLDLDDNNITDISPLKNLTNLEYLSLRANNLTDVFPLSNLV